MLVAARKLVSRLVNGAFGNAFLGRESAGCRAAAWAGVAVLLISLLSASQAFAQTATTTNVTSISNPATYPQNETFTATVTSTSTVNEGTVIFQSDGSTIAACSAQSVSNGTAICVTQLAAGSHTIQAFYTGDTNFASSSSSALTQAVNSAVTATLSIASKALTQNMTVSSFTPVTGGGGTGSLTYSISPSLPTGLSIDASTGTISGTPTVTQSTTSYTVTVNDTNGQTASNSFILTVNSAVTATQAIASKALTQGVTVSSFTPVTGSGGTSALSYNVAPTLPTGLNFNSSTGAITGTPSVTQPTSSFTVTVNDTNGQTASDSFMLTVNSAVTATQAIASKALTQGVTVSSFTPVTGSGGTSTLSYSVAPTLPTGLNFNSSTGAITGTPSVTQPTSSFTVTVTDALGSTASISFMLTVNSAVAATQSIASKALTQGVTVSSFTPVTGSGGASPLSYGVAPTLPAGLTMAPTTGTITGAPTATLGATTFTVTVTDQNNATATNTFSLTVNGTVTATQAIASKTLTVNLAAAPFKPVSGSGGTGSLTYAVSPTLPPGVAMDSGTGIISGQPTATSGATAYTVTVTDQNSQTATATFSLAVNGAVDATQAIASTALTQNHTATPFTPVTGSGGASPLSYSVAPTLPAGLTMAPTTGTITGMPTAAHAASSFTVTVTDANGATGTASFNLTVDGTVTATTAVASTSLTVNHPATSFTPVTGSGGVGALTYSVSPTLPAGLSFNPASGAITGTPTATIAATAFTVTVTDINNATATANFNLTVNGAVSATTAIASTTLIVNRPATSFTPVTGAGGTNPLTYSVSPALPTGLSFNTANGAITGTPTVISAAAAYTVTVTDADNATATATFSLTVGASTTTAALASSQNPSSFGQAVTFTATVNGGGGTPSGTVTFNDAGTAIGTATLSAGVAAFTTSTLKTGTHAITAVYGGNGTFSPSTSPALTQTVNVPADSVKLHALQVNVTKVVAQGSGQAISGAIDSAVADGFADDGTFLTPSATGFHFNFAADPYEERGAGDASAAGSGTSGGLFGGTAHAYGSTSAAGNDPMGRQRNGRIDNAFAALDQQMPEKAPPKRFREEKNWLFWIDIRGTGLDRLTSTTTAVGVTTAAAPLYGFQVNALMGLTYKAAPNLLVGVLGGYETFNYTEQDINGKLTGNGWTVGPYLGWKITPTLRYDAAVTYSGIGYDGIAGTAQGNFNGQRWLISTGLTGTYKAAGLVFEPSAKVYALWENEGAYVDSLGTQQASHDFSTGRASAGAKVAYPLAWSDTVSFAPYFGVYGDYYFDQDNADAIVAAGGVPLASTPLLEGWSARVAGGVGVKFASGGSVGVGAEYGGIGSNFGIWTITAKAGVPF
ncbi:putative Ig domain-containing protein [Bradyrhizobium canariense]|uniref:putative Ig domain-containing protein n=1 Tax=Bradyrhizobium canariense TaxID=255045 RepID=UPI001430353C|nr:putative Ig domain-containing protein [Bradyrhizobium canariense]